MTDGFLGDPDVEAVDRSEWAIQDEEVREYLLESTDQIGSLVRTTLGPRGMEKLIETHDYHGKPENVLTGDADEILDAIQRGEGFNDPVAALFVDSIDTMQRALGDGTGTTVVLGSAFIERGVELIEEGLHPSSVLIGYSMAAQRAGAVLDDLAEPLDPTDRETLAEVAATAMTADITPAVRERYAEAVAEAVATLAEESDDGWIDTDAVDVIAEPGATDRLYDGVILQRRPGLAREDEKSHLEFDWSPSVEGVRHDVTLAVMDEAPAFGDAATAFDETVVDPTQHAADRVARTDRREAFADRLADLGVGVLVCRDEVDDRVVAALDAHGIDVVDRAQYPKTDVFRLADATGASVVSHPEDVTEDTVGVAGRVSEEVREEEKWAVFDDCDGAALTLVVGADTATGVTERERLVEDALEVASVAAIDGQLLPGGGAPAAAVAAELRAYAPSVEGREQLAVETFGEVVEEIPRVLARNAGHDPVDAVASLREHHRGEAPSAVGLDLETGGVADAYDAGVVEPRRVFSQAIETARASAEQLLTVDAVLFPNVDLESFNPETEHE